MVSLYKKCVYFLVLCMTSFCVFPVLATASYSYSSTYFLRELPVTIFENTEWPISEEIKGIMLQIGYCKDWKIGETTPNYMLISAIEPREGTVEVQVFRGPTTDEGAVVLSASGSMGCTAEIWKYDELGTLVPLEDLPNITYSDFYTTQHDLKDHQSFSYGFCLKDKKIYVLPTLWENLDMRNLKVEKGVFLAWDGKKFEKIAENFPSPIYIPPVERGEEETDLFHEQP